METNMTMTPTASATTTLPDTDVIDASHLRQLILEDPAIRILDVRSGGEFNGIHIPGSYNVPLDGGLSQMRAES